MSNKTAILICAISLAAGIGAGFIPQPLFEKTATERELASAVVNGDVSAVKNLLAKQPRVNWPKEESNPSLLASAISGLQIEHSRIMFFQGAKGDVRPERREVIRLLLNAGADPNERAYFMIAALHMADTELLKMLIDHGGRVVFKREANGSAYYMESIPNSPQDFDTCLTLAQKAGLDLNHRDASGRTIMHSIAWSFGMWQKERLAALEIMVKHGLDINAKDCLGMTPYDYATSDEARKWLASHGAIPSN